MQVVTILGWHCVEYSEKNRELGIDQQLIQCRIIYHYVSQGGLHCAPTYYFNPERRDLCTTQTVPHQYGTERKVIYYFKNVHLLVVNDKVLSP